MKALSFIDKLFFLLNSVLAFFLLVGYIVPYLQPKSFVFVSLLSLAIPTLIITNVLFALFWFLKGKKQWLLSLFVVLLGYKYTFSLYQFSPNETSVDDSISIMNYNVRLFNLYNWIDKENMESKIVNFINAEEPDIISFQEYTPIDSIQLAPYPYTYKGLSGKRVQYGQAIYSKFPIINSGSFKFQNTGNNAIYADIVKNKDTIRVYNIHLQSAGINAEVEKLTKENSEFLLNRLANTFKKQQEQAESFMAHRKNSPYRLIICGDFNNTAYSYVYRLIKDDLIDTFEEAGKGFGSTYHIDYFPLRIDFILADSTFKIDAFKNYTVEYSDHYPILTKLSLD